MTLATGSRLGPYEILAPIGAGGMGEVYRARDPRLGRDVAIEVMPDAAGAADERLRRFEQEARAVAALSHPNVLAIFDIDIGDAPYLVTELLDGDTLRAVLDRGPLPPRRVIDLARRSTRRWRSTRSCPRRISRTRCTRSTSSGTGGARGGTSWRRARRHFVAALALNPRVAMFEAYFALFLAAEYEYAEARQRIDRALALDPHSAAVQFLVAAAACAMGDAALAARHADRALELEPESMGPRWPQTVALTTAAASKRR